MHSPLIYRRGLIIFRSAEVIKKFMPPLPTNDYEEFLSAIALSIGALEKGGHPDLLRANRWLLEAFRDGRLGSWTLDDLTFTGPAYPSLPEPGASPLMLNPPPAVLSVEEPEDIVEPLDSPPEAQANALVPKPPNELTVPANLSLPDRVSLSVSAWLAHHHHRLHWPKKAQMSSHALKKAEKAEAAEKHRLKMQRKGISTRSRFLTNAPAHLRTKTGKSSLAFRRANQARKRLRKAQGKGR